MRVATEIGCICFTYQHMECLFTPFKIQFSGKTVAKRREVFDNVQRAVCFNKNTEERTKCPAFAKNPLEKKIQQTFFELIPKDKIDADNCISYRTELNLLK